MININRLSRRQFLRVGGAALGMFAAAGLPAWLPRMAFAAPDTDLRGDVLVVIFLRGGLDGLSAVVPMFDADYYRARPTLAVPEPASSDDSSAIDLDGAFGLNPALRPLKDLWDAGDLGIVHAVGSPDPTHSHFDAMDYMERGTPGEKSLTSGWIGRHIETAAWDNDSPFRVVGMGGVAQTSLRGPISPTTLQSIADFHLQGNTAELAAFQETLAQLYSFDARLNPAAAATFDAIALLDGLDVTDYVPANGASYPESDFGLALQQVAQLVRAEVGLEVAAIDQGGYDTHANQDGGGRLGLADLLSDYAAGLAAFYTDMRDHMGSITVVTMSEFGRRLAENASAGTDHGHGGVMFALGAGVAGGRVYGPWPGLAADQLYGPGDLDITTDFRDVLGELVANRLGNAAGLPAIFPDFERTALGLFVPR